MKNRLINEYEIIEEEFFEIDKKNKTARVKLAFDKPGNIFDINYISKRPVFSDEFSDWIKSAFRMIPGKYKIDLEVAFSDMEGWNEEDLRENFRKNILLDFKTEISDHKKKSKTALGLIGVGVLFFASMILISRLWPGNSVIKQVVSYVSDIATTVTFWEAMTILVVEQSENRSDRAFLAKRFNSIVFRMK